MSLLLQYLPPSHEQPKRSNARVQARAPRPGGSWAGRSGNPGAQRLLSWAKSERTLAKRAAGSSCRKRLSAVGQRWR